MFDALGMETLAVPANETPTFVSVLVGTSGNKKRKSLYKEDGDEVKLSKILAAQLQQAQLTNAALLQAVDKLASTPQTVIVQEIVSVPPAPRQNPIQSMKERMLAQADMQARAESAQAAEQKKQDFLRRMAEGKAKKKGKK